MRRSTFILSVALIILISSLMLTGCDHAGNFTELISTSGHSGSTSGDIAQVSTELTYSELASAGCNNQQMNNTRGALASDGESLFAIVNDGKAIQVSSLSDQNSVDDRVLIYECEVSNTTINMITHIIVKDGWVYAILTDFFNGKSDLIKIKTNGSEVTVLADNFVISLYIICIDDGWLYYIDHGDIDEVDYEMLKRISLDGSKNEIIDQDDMIWDTFFISDKWIYYNKGIDFETAVEKGLKARNYLEWYRIPVDGGQPEKIGLTDEMIVTAVYQGYIYYLENKTLYRRSIGGDETTLIMKTADGYSCLNIVDNTIYYCWSSSFIYKIPVDASNIDRHDLPYVVFDESFCESNAVWIFDGQIWIKDDNMGAPSQTYYNVTGLSLTK